MGDNFTRSYTCAREVGIACQGSVEQPLEKPSLSESPLDPHQEEEEEKKKRRRRTKKRRKKKKKKKKIRSTANYGMIIPRIFFASRCGVTPRAGTYLG